MEFTSDCFVQHVRRVIERFYTTRNVSRRDFTGRLTILTADVIAKIFTMPISPNKFITW